MKQIATCLTFLCWEKESVKKSWQVSDHRAWLSSHEAKDDKRMKLKKRRPSWKENAIEKRLGHLANVHLKNVSFIIFLSYYLSSIFAIIKVKTFCWRRPFWRYLQFLLNVSLTENILKRKLILKSNFVWSENKGVLSSIFWEFQYF